MNKKILLFIPFLLFVFCSKINSQNNWYALVQMGGKVSFFDSRKSILSHSAFSSFSHDDATFATQYGFRFGKKIWSNKFNIESGLSLSGHAHNFKYIWGEKDFLGDKLNHRLTYYVFEWPLIINYRLFDISEKWAIMIGVSGKLNFWGFRPFWGERNPWKNKYSLAKPHIQTTYFIPDSPNAYQRQVLSYRGRGITGRNILSAMGNINIMRGLNEKYDLRLSFSYSYGLGFMSSELLEIKNVFRDDFGVLVQDGADEVYSSSSKTTNVSFDIGLVRNF